MSYNLTFAGILSIARHASERYALRAAGTPRSQDAAPVLEAPISSVSFGLAGSADLLDVAVDLGVSCFPSEEPQLA